MNKNILNYYFLFLISIIPFTFLIGPAISLSNLLLFDLSFLIFLILRKESKFIDNSILKLLIILYLYLIFNTFMSLDQNLSFYRNFGFIRLIIFFIGINYFFLNNKFEKFYFFWALIIFVVIIDILIEKYSGSNILGYTSGHDRIVSFFKDEAIPGGFVHAFTFLIIGYFFKIFSKKSKYLQFLVISIFLLFAFLAIVSTGERSNTIKFSLSFIIFFFFLDKISKNKKIVLSLSLILMLILLIMNNSYLKNRMFISIQHSAKTFTSSFMHDKPWDNPSGNLYAKLYRSGYEVSKNYPYFGVGNKNYRIESCDNKKYILNIHRLTNDYVCMTHPHQIYFELLSEHGLIGSIIILSIFTTIIFKIFRKILDEKNYIGLGCLAYLIPVFSPILPSGSFFSDYNITLLFINLSVLYASTINSNIFSYKKNGN